MKSSTLKINEVNAKKYEKMENEINQLINISKTHNLEANHEIQNKITNLDTTLNEEDSVDKDVVKKIKDKNNE